MEEEVFFQCPYCFEQISMLVDAATPTDQPQSYIEDCEVCCRPIEITFKATQEGVAVISTRRAQ